jgi:hypothetical protein
VRALEVLKGLGPQGIVASICPANTSDRERGDYGYRPAIRAIAERLEVPLRGRCLPRPLVIESDQTVHCTVIEAYTPREGESCDCKPTLGRSPAAAEVLTPDVLALGPCICAIDQLGGASRSACQRDEVSPSGASGWCYVDPAQSGDRALCKLVSKCLPSQRRIIHYSGLAPRGRTIIMCNEQSKAADADVCAAP